MAAAAGTAALSGLPLARSAQAAGSDVIRIGLIGCGSRGPGAAINAMTADDGVRLVAMSDVLTDRVRSRREMLQRCNPGQVKVADDHCFSGLDGYQHVIAGVDVVLIACSEKYHPVYLRAANAAMAQSNAWDLEHKVLFSAIRSGNPVNCGDYMARSTLVAIMGQLACYSGKELTWEEICKSDFVCTPKVENVRLDMTPPVKPDEKGNYPVPMPGITEFKIWQEH